MTLIEEIETESNKIGKITRLKETEKERAIILKSMNMKKIKETMKIRREPEALPEGIDPEEKIETIRDNIEETKALIEGSRHLKEGAEGTTALKGEEKEVRGITLLKEGEDTQIMRSEGVARDPLVKRDPFQAIL